MPVFLRRTGCRRAALSASATYRAARRSRWISCSARRRPELLLGVILRTGRGLGCGGHKLRQPIVILRDDGRRVGAAPIDGEVAAFSKERRQDARIDRPRIMRTVIAVLLALRARRGAG